MRILDFSYYSEWAQKYDGLKISNFKHGIPDNSFFTEETSVLPGHENENLRLQNEIESELFLLGATALEDKL
jgi:hypothetical protein